MRRLLTALPVALIVVGLLPLAVLAGVPEGDAQSVSATEDTAKPIVLTATESSAVDVTDFTAGSPSHGSLSETGTIGCDGMDPVHCSQEVTYTPDPDYNGPDSFTFTATSDDAPVRPGDRHHHRRSGQRRPHVHGRLGRDGQRGQRAAE